MAQIAVLEAELEARHEQELLAMNQQDRTVVVGYNPVPFYTLSCVI